MHDDAKPDRPAPTLDAQATPPAERRPYQSPVLVEYGSVAKLTRGSLSTSSDPSGHKSVCL
jgi:hypothetical protein